MRWLARALAPSVGVAALAAGLAVAPAGAAGGHGVRCIGDADYCVATLDIGRGVSNRRVTVTLTGTDLALVGAYTIPVSARRAFTITNASFGAGGSQYRFTLNARPSTPRRSRLVLLFSAGGNAGKSGLGGGRLKLGTWRAATAILDVGAGMTVSIKFGDTHCTRDETNTTFVTKTDGERHEFGFDSKGSGSCFWQTSWADFRFTVKDPTGKQVGTGVLSIDQNNAAASYYMFCRARSESESTKWRGVNCTIVGDPYDRVARIERIY